MPLASLRKGAFVLMLFLFALLPALGTAHSAQPGQATLPTITSASSTIDLDGAIQVIGANFTPGGAVFVAVYDRWGNEAHETRWTIASEDTLASDNTSNPALGFHPGGVVIETFDLASAIPASDQRTAFQEIAGREDVEPFADTDGVAFDHVCVESAMIRAFDVQSGTWSNLLDIRLGCDS